MTRYNRVTGIQWPVTFVVEDGRRFTVPSPAAGTDPTAFDLIVEGGQSSGRYDLGPDLGEQTTGAIIGRAIRWWIETTGQRVVIVTAASNW